MKETDEELVGRLHREAVERAGQKGSPLRPVERPTIHYTNLPAGRPNSPLRTEWDCYRREVARLLAEGHEGRFVLIKGKLIVGLYTTEAEALEQGYQNFHGEAFLVHQVQERETALLCPPVRLCRS
jgi:hypothetical protein